MTQLEQLTSHIEQVKKGSQALNTDLLDSFRITGVSQLSGEESQSLAVQLYQLLPDLQSDPTHVCQLLEALLKPWPLNAILQIEPPVDFAAGLAVYGGPFNDLTLSLLEKGISDIASARRLATSQPAIFTALLKLWLCTEVAGTASRAGSIIQGLLRADHELDGSGLLPQADEDVASLAADNPVWRRVFRDPDVYGELYANTDLAYRDQSGLSKGQVTIAQARLMEFVPKLASLDWNAALRSHVPSVERSHGLANGEGLLHYAAINMVDVNGDVLMHRSLINFYADLLQSHSEEYSGSSSISPPLAFLLDHKLHDRTVNIYTTPDDPAHDPLDITFLYAAAAQYVSTYATTCSPHFTNSPAARSVLARLSQILNIPPSRWHSSPPSAADLHVLASVPRPILLPSSAGDENPHFFVLPTRPAHADAFNTLATILHGPILEQTFPARDVTKQDQLEMQTARQLYNAYLSRNPRMWSDITAAADTVAMVDAAIAAINVVRAVATAAWASNSTATDIDGDARMSNVASGAGGSRGIEALLSPPALTIVLPWLLRPPQQFSGLVGGRGDAEDAAYKVATAKYDCLQVVEKRLLEWMADEGSSVEERRGELERIAHAVRERLGEGVWGARGDVGGRIATLEL